ncbi:MAG: exopolysaccharide biosynthesis polyprenyl glycosylphosphotransferase [Nocardioides sp.]|uniref:exopolysaccharide biosynthesis polyprenyl glycosylphosphotransferase n=1 Tax=Nocardioides sp. TaxID=35761 RepID=UPI0039E6D9E1
MTSQDVVVPLPRAATPNDFAGGIEAPRTHPAERVRRRLREWYLPIELGLAAALALTVLVISDTPLVFGSAVAALALVVNYHAGRETVRPGLPHIGRILKDQGVPVTAVAVGMVLGIVPGTLLSDTLWIVGAVAVVAVAGTVARRAVSGQMRLLVVGSPADVAKSATRWAGDNRAKVVGALALGEEGVDLSDLDSFGVRAIGQLDEVEQWVQRWDADLVVLIPGDAITADVVQRLAWHLEDTHASMAVTGLLDKVAPHRIDTARFADGTLLHVRSSKRSAFVRTVKHAVDRLAAVALLAMAGIPLLTMMALVRLDSRGPAIFKQTRVGLDGKTFTMYKLRTMRVDAEKVKAELATMDEGNGVLFKIRDDPRVTRAGRLLRKTSLDELPQLMNVVLGQMSLVGPRPALPEEVAKYTPTERRRLAVRPGITGLWQVSGRSNLSWERSVELDLHYADNWRLTSDVLIGLRTADAVVRSRGAY